MHEAARPAWTSQHEASGCEPMVWGDEWQDEHEYDDVHVMCKMMMKRSI